LAFAKSHYGANENDHPPSLDVYTLDTRGASEETRCIKTFFFPRLDYSASVDGQIRIEQLMIRSDPAPCVIADPEHPYPFVLDPAHRVYILTLVLVIEANVGLVDLPYHFMIPLSSIMEYIPRSLGGQADVPENEIVSLWETWGPRGSRVRFLFSLQFQFIGASRIRFSHVMSHQALMCATFMEHDLLSFRSL
jgi:hypothetical protein